MNGNLNVIRAVIRFFFLGDKKHFYYFYYDVRVSWRLIVATLISNSVNPSSSFFFPSLLQTKMFYKKSEEKKRCNQDLFPVALSWSNWQWQTAGNQLDRERTNWDHQLTLISRTLCLCDRWLPVLLNGTNELTFPFFILWRIQPLVCHIIPFCFLVEDGDKSNSPAELVHDDGQPTSDARQDAR